jgi:hypothetical protein
MGGYGFIVRAEEVLYTPHSDIIAYHLAAKEMLWKSWEAGRGIPFWRGDQLAGGPAFTSPNTLYTYPLHALFYVLPPTAAVGWTVLFHIALGGIVYYVVGHTLGLTRLSSLFTAVASLFSFKMIMAVYAGWLSVLPSIVLFPLLFAAVIRLVSKPGPVGMLAATAVGVLCLHGGQLQHVYYSLWFVVAYAVVALGIRWRDGDRLDAVYSAACLIGAGILSLGLAAYFLLPFAAELHLVTRTAASEEFFRAGRSLRLPHLLTLLSPEALGTVLDGNYPGVEMWEDVAYFGLVPLCLAVLGVALGWRRRPTVFFASGFVLSLLRYSTSLVAP